MVESGASGHRHQILQPVVDVLVREAGDLAAGAEPVQYSTVQYSTGTSALGRNLSMKGKVGVEAAVPSSAWLAHSDKPTCIKISRNPLLALGDSAFLDPVGSLVSTLWVGCGLWVTLLSKIVNFECVGMC